MQAQMGAVTLDRVSKKFGASTVVDAVSLAVADGEFMVLVGPSGCGKSTTLRMIAGLEESSSGTIRINDRDVTRLEPRDRNIAMVFQNYALYPHKSVFDNMAFGLRMRSLARAEVERRVRHAAGILGITELLGRRPRQLSGGQMQRVALGRALVREPEAFLLDEPLSNLDAKMRVRMREEIARLHKQVGTSMIFVTHDQVEAMTLGDRIAVMEQGQVRQVGRPLEVYDRPASRFVAAFIGSPEMNFVEGVVAAGPVFQAGSLVLPLDPARLVVPEAGTRVVLGIRPEHLLPAAVGIAARVELVERLGAQMLLFLDASGAKLRALIARDDAVDAGHPITVAPQPGRIHLFDHQSGASLATA
jgi:multiple sugar transport system ATP-binding protein